jgi:hypothetical protein
MLETVSSDYEKVAGLGLPTKRDERILLKD